MFEHAEQASSRGVLEGGGATGLLNEGGGSNRLPALVSKQAVKFPQVYTSLYIIVFAHGTVTNYDEEEEEDRVSRSKGWANWTKLTPINTFGAPARIFPQ